MQHSTTSHFTVQVEIDIESSGINLGQSNIWKSSGTLQRRSLNMPEKISSFTSGFKPHVGAVGVTITNFDENPELHNLGSIAPIYGIQPDTGLASPSSRLSNPSWNAPCVSSPDGAQGFRTSVFSKRNSPSSIVEREEEESFQGAATKTLSEIDQIACPLMNLATRTRASNNDGSYDPSHAQAGLTPPAWVFEASMTKEACPYTTR